MGAADAYLVDKQDLIAFHDMKFRIAFLTNVITEALEAIAERP